MQIALRIECGEAALLARELYRAAVGGMANRLHHPGCQFKGLRRAVADTQHDQCIGQTCNTQADATRLQRLLLLLRQWKTGDVDDIVQETHRQLRGILQ